LSFFVGAFGAVPLALLRRDMRFREIASMQSTGILVQSAASVLLVWAGMSFWGILWGHLAGSFTLTALTMYYARWWPKLAFSMAAFRDLASFGFGSYVVKVLEYGALNADNLIIGRVLGITALGYYDRAFTVMDRVINRLNAAGPSLSFRVFALIHEDAERFRRAWRKMTLTVALVGYPVLAWLCVAAPEMIIVLFGRQWEPSVVPFQLLCVAGMLKLMNEYASAVAQAAGWIWSQATRQALYLTFIVIGVFALREFGLVGAAFGVLGATMMMTALMVSLLRTATPLRWRDIVEPQLPGVYCAVPVVALLMTLKLLAFEVGGTLAKDMVLLAIEAVVGGLACLAWVWFTKSEDVRSIIREFLGDISPRLAAAFR
jgi:PST family polysaccharide transporter